MNLTQKLLSSCLISFCFAFAPGRQAPVLAQALEQSEIRALARDITVKIVDSGTSSNGSGVLFNRKNNVYSVLTNQHVAGNKGNYDIFTPDGQKHKITFKEEIPGLDLMVVQFQSDRDYETVEIGDSEEIAPLQLVYVAGYPAVQADLDIVDGKIRSIRQDVLQNPQNNLGYALVYTNQTLPGSSGGAILDEYGYLVGINGEAERDITSGRDISRGIPINLFISLSFNHLPEDQFEVESAESEYEEEYEIEEPEAEYEAEEQDRDEADSIAYLPNVSANVGNSNYALAYSLVEEEEDEIESVAITPDGRTVVTAVEEQLQIWNGLTGKLEQTLNNGEREIKAVALSADGRTIVTCGDDEIKIWNRYTGQVERTLGTEDDEVNSIALSPNGQIIVSGGDDGEVKVWNRYTGKLERTLEGHEDEVKSVAISANGETIVSGGQDREVKVWNWRSWELKHSLKGHEEEVRTVAISADGRTIVSGSGDKTIKVWDRSGQLKSTLRGHEGKVDSLVLTNDGDIISGSRDRTIKIWDLQTQTLEQSLSSNNSSRINSIAASANKNIVVSGGKDRSLAIWHRQR
ncbi:MAG: trypsin-like peptidase domain-containing protein [Cyanobacteria bacterium J06600_6]